MIENMVQGSSSSLILTKSQLLNFKGSTPRIKAASGNSFCIFSDRLFHVYSAVNVDSSLRCQKIFSKTCKQSIVNTKYTHHLMLLATTNTLQSFDLDYSEIDKYRINHILGMGVSSHKSELLVLCQKQILLFQCKQSGLSMKSKQDLKKSYNDVGLIDVLHSSSRPECYFIFLTIRTAKADKLFVDEYTKGKEQADRFQISEVSEPDLFTKSKVYVLEDDQFLLSLKNEVIAIKKKQKIYIVLDNVSSTSNNQFLLTSSTNLFYMEETTVFGYSIAIKKQKIQLNLIDSFVDSKDPLNKLYDGVLLDTIDQRITLIFSAHSGDLTFDMGLRVSGICQVNPMNKLTDMLNQKATVHQIYGFARRYSFNTLDYLKTKWESSKKQVPDILNLLVYVKDLKFLKTQLAELLNHPQIKYSCSDLIKIKERTMQVYVNSVIEDGVSQPKIRQIMKCIIFIRKMSYLNEFEAFKKLGAFQIKQMKSWTFKQHIKLLFCKGYYKRLAYFLTVFKYLFVTEYEQVIDCLLSKMTAGDIINFLKTDRFFLPRHTPFWENLLDCNPLTPQTLLSTIVNTYTITVNPERQQQIRWAISKVQDSQWFNEFFFIKHCVTQVSLSQLEPDFQYLKENRAYDCIMKHLYDNFDQTEVMKIYNAIVELNILPPRYSRKIQLYNVFLLHLNEACRQKKVRVQKKNISVRDLLKLKSQSFLYEVIEVLGEEQLYTKIKGMYDSVSRGYFEETFILYVNFIKETDYLALISLLVPFRAMHSSFQMANQQILNCLLKIIFQRCTIISQKQINIAFQQLVHVKVQKRTLAKLDKFIKCSNFCSFFRSFDISTYTFENFWAQISNPQTDIFQKIIYRYVCQEFLPFKIGQKEFRINTPYDEMLPILLYLYGEFEFKIPHDSIVRYFLTRMIQSQMFDTIKTIIQTEYLKPLVGSTYIYTRTIIVKILESQYKGGWAIVRRMPFLNRLLDLLKKKDSKHERAFLNIFQQLEEIVPDINASDLRTRFFQKNSPVFFVRFLLTCIPEPKLPFFPFQSIFKHLGLRKKGTPEEQEDYVMVQLQVGYHHVRCLLYEQVLQIIESISLKYECSCYVDELTAYLVGSICQKKIKNEYSTRDFIQKFIDSLGKPESMLVLIKKIISFKEDEQQNQNSVGEMMKSKINEKVTSSSYFFTETLDTKSIIKLISKLNLLSNQHFYIIFLQILSTNPLLAIYISIKFHQITLQKLIQLSELIFAKSVPSTFYKFMTICIYLKSLIVMSPQVIVNWSYLLTKERQLSGLDCKVQINLLSAKMGQQNAKILMKYYQQFMETQGLRAQIVLGESVSDKKVQFITNPSGTSIIDTKTNIIQEKSQSRSQSKAILIVDRQQIRAQVEVQIRQAKARYTRSEFKPPTQSADLVNSPDIKVQSPQNRQFTITGKLTSILDRKEGIKNSEDFIKKFREEVAQKFKIARESMSKQKSATSIRMENKDLLRHADSKTRMTPTNIVISKRSAIASKQLWSPQPSTPKEDVILSPLSSLHQNHDRRFIPLSSSLLDRDEYLSPRDKQIANSSLALSEQIVSGQTGKKVDPRVSDEVRPEQQKLNMSERVHEQLSSFKENELLAKINKYRYGYDNPTFAKQILKKIYVDAKQPICFTNVLKVFQKYSKVQLAFSHKAAQIFQKISHINLPFDVRRLFSFDYFFLDLKQDAQRQTLKFIKPRLIEQLQKDNLYCISKMCNFALGTTNKNVEEIISTYYVEKTIKQHIKNPKTDSLAIVMTTIKLSEDKIVNRARYLYKILKAIGSSPNLQLVKEITKFMKESSRKGIIYERAKEYKEKMLELKFFSQQAKESEQSTIEELLKIIDTL